jgi:hypothetical protein
VLTLCADDTVLNRRELKLVLLLAARDPGGRALPGPAGTRRDLAAHSSTISVTIRVRWSC